MLPIHIRGGEFWNEKEERFIYTKPVTLKLEHSLVSISKWEAKWHISFIDDEKTDEQLLDYIRCMTLNNDVDPIVYKLLTAADFKKINDYIEDTMTATTINDTKKGKRRTQKLTNELIYCWMIQFGIPVEFEKWHLNRLITLIRVCSEEAQPTKKRNAADLARSYKELNAARKAKWGTKG